MILDNVIDLIKSISEWQPNVNSVTEGSIYEALNTTGEVDYANIHITQSKHIENENKQEITYNFILFYTDRLMADKSNKITIQSIGINVLKNILRTIEESDEDIYISATDFQTFTEQFSDVCAGVYSNVSITVPIEYNCAEKWGNAVDKIAVGQIKNEWVEVDIDENGQLIVTYDPKKYTGIERVIINTNVPKSVLTPMTVFLGERAFWGNTDIVNTGVVNVIYGASLMYMFSKCQALEVVEDVRTNEDVQNTSFMFYNCKNLKKVTITGKGYENVDKMEYMFGECINLTDVDIQGIHLSSTKMEYKRGMFNNCPNLENLKIQNIPPNFYIDWGFETCTKLTVDSLMNIINALEDAWDFIHQNAKESVLILGEENMAKLTEEQLRIGRDKGWSIV